ncbi:MAG TPA: hypothetical protein VE693_10670 [Gaiellaceae bacterium]|jgi:hypothetical protein|nr:hypothetical protein [Gaiellaceae bacterium]
MSTESIMVRLRRANPVPQAPAGEDNELFARITAEAADSRLTERTRPRVERRRRVVVAAFALLVAALLASTAFAISQWIGGDVVPPPVTKQEYLEAQKELSLPPGVKWPKYNMGEPNSVTNRGAGGGQAVLVAQNAWECYWVDAIKRGDAAAGQQAHNELNKLLANNIREAPAWASENWAPTPLPDHPVVYFAHDGGLAWVKNNYRQAAGGDPTGISQSCKANAPG